MRETESKIILRSCREINELSKRLEDIGFKLVEEVYEEDHYYNHPCRDFKRTDEALRIRLSIIRHQGMPRTKYTLTYKGPKKIIGRSKTREEVIAGIDDPEQLHHLLEKLGFNKVGIVRKTRTYYKRDTIVVSLDRVEGLGCFAEIEIERGAEKSEKILDKIVHELGLNNYVSTYKSYLELILEKNK